jgi:hypothetical protein
MNFQKWKKNKLLDAYLVYNGTANDLVLMQQLIFISKWDSITYVTGNTNDQIYQQVWRGFPRTNVDYDRVNIGLLKNKFNFNDKYLLTFI